MARRTPLHAAHAALGARFVEFAGWEMPVMYAGAADEHRAVRERCGLFDVSHMGEIEAHGPGALALVQRLTVNDIGRLRIGAGQYTLFCNPRGGVLDDLIVFRVEAERYLMVVNAANTDSDLAWVRSHAEPDVEVIDRSAACVLLALQGPGAERALRPHAPVELGGLLPFDACRTTIAGIPALVSRTGYTGEDGFELLADADRGPELWEVLLEATRRGGGCPAGLAARDTLRLEAGLPLCGSDMDASITPIEAGLGWVVKVGKGDFVGRPVLAEQVRVGASRRLVGIRLDEPGIPRHGCPVWCDARHVGEVTSGARSPTLGSFIALGLVARDAAATGTLVEIEIRGRRLPGRVVDRPFYRRVQH